MAIHSLKECKSVDGFNGFVEKLEPQLGRSGGRRFVHQKNSYTMNALVLQFHAQAKSANAQEIEVGLHHIEKLEKETHAKLTKLTPCQRLLYRICKALGNFFFRLKYKQSREEFLKEIRNKFLKQAKQLEEISPAEPEHITNPHDIPTDGSTTPPPTTEIDEGHPEELSVLLARQAVEIVPGVKFEVPVMDLPQLELLVLKLIEGDYVGGETFSADTVREAFKRFFVQELVEEMEKRYFPQGLLEHLSMADIRAFSIGIVALPMGLIEAQEAYETISRLLEEHKIALFSPEEMWTLRDRPYYGLLEKDIEFLQRLSSQKAPEDDEREDNVPQDSLASSLSASIIANEFTVVALTSEDSTALQQSLSRSLSASTFVMVQSPKEILIEKIKRGHYDVNVVYTNEVVKAAFETVYGFAALEALKLYFKTTLPGLFDNFDLIALQIAILANLTVEDVKFSLKKENLSSEELIIELARLRTCPSPSPLELIGLQKKAYWYQLYRDLAFLDACKVEDFDTQPKDPSFKHKHLAYAEYLGHRLPYAMHKRDEAKYREGALVLYPINDQQGHRQEMLMRAYQLIGEPGLQATVLIPVDHDSIAQEIPVQVLFRGSNENLAPWMRNFSPFEIVEGVGEGPGHKSFLTQKLKMMQRFKELIAQIPHHRSLKVEIFGHSLGATDTQRFCAALADLMVNEPIYQSIKKIQTFAFNPPGVEFKTSHEFLNAASKLPDTQFHLSYFKVEHDGVQMAGNCLLGYAEKGEIPPNLSTAVFKFNWPEGDKPFDALRKMLTAHMLYNFTRQAKGWLEDVRTSNLELKIKKKWSSPKGVPVAT